MDNRPSDPTCRKASAGGAIHSPNNSPARPERKYSRELESVDRLREKTRQLERQGKAYIVVDQYAPAAKTCHACGRVNEQLSARERSWTCPSCGVVLTREVNTARNLREFGLKEIGALSAVSYPPRLPAGTPMKAQERREALI